MTPAREPRAWLSGVSWQTVIATNQSLCIAKSALHKPTSEGYEPARQLWESRHREAMTLTEMAELCRSCHKLAPFCLFNGNSFAAVARMAITGLLRTLPAEIGASLRSVMGHYVAGVAHMDELAAVIAATGTSENAGDSKS